MRAQEVTLDSPIGKIKGVGYSRKKIFLKYGIKTIKDLLYFKPKRYIDRRVFKSIKDLNDGEEAVIMGKVFAKGERKKGNKKFFVVILSDDTGFIELIFVNTFYIKEYFKLDRTVVVSGKVRKFGSVFQIFHPEFEILDRENQNLIHSGKIVPVYSSLAQENPMRSHVLRKIIYSALSAVYSSIPETLPEEIRKKFGLLKRRDSLKNLHFPDNYETLDNSLYTLKFEELFFFFLKLFIYRKNKVKAPAFISAPDLTKKFLINLPFELTESQRKAIREIYVDLSKPYSMRKLLQGDVGSGKTVVAIYSALRAIENGFQVAFMAPTEILAEQHYETMRNLTFNLGIKYDLLTSNVPIKEKNKIYERVKSGEIEFIIGTHALLEEKLEFKNLGLVIIDEQHKFGVSQRARLLQKGESPHFLVMTATPIPRTLALTYYGDLDVLTLKEMPKGRGIVETKVVYTENREEFYKRLFEAIKEENSKAYIIAPLIEESERLNSKSCIELYEEIKNKWAGDIKINFIHGRMKKEERTQRMEKFRSGEIKVLVSTTVLEVGIDVPDVKYMVIEGAERFGLSTLHQLRGRLARKIEKGYCFIFCSKNMPSETLKRISVFRRTSDGFKLSELDLKLRGPGNILGYAQSGFFSFKFSDLIEDKDLLINVREVVKNLLTVDPFLEKKDNKYLKNYLSSEEKFWLTEVA
ncbi:MAG: ATP-dependent DNA helicase RecG [Candidatus Hydrothermales bacterium]